MPSPSIGSLIFVRLFRLWSASRSTGDHPLPAMQDFLAPFAPGPELVPELTVAAASLFELVEAHLGRRLEPECCCSHACSRDELALLGVLRHAPEAGQPISGAAIPHGLPGAIRWASFAVRRSLGESFGPLFEPEVAAEAPANCPFSRPRPVFARAPRAAATAGTI